MTLALASPKLQVNTVQSTTYATAQKQMTRNCKYWPLIRELQPDGNFGAIVMVRPNKVDKLLAKKPYSGRYQREENLSTNRLIGPFDFTQIDHELNRIDAKHWSTLLTLSASTPSKHAALTASFLSDDK
jgi:hypothetical protein